MATGPGLFFQLLLFGAPWLVPRQLQPDTNGRFPKHSLCAAEECSLFVYRDEALENFTGPDCRCVNFKKGDPVYVYYKLAGKVPEFWAITVGYSPNNLIQVVDEPTKEELEDAVHVPEESTTAQPGHRDHREDVPIISSFLKGQQSLQWLQKYFDVQELEAMVKEMSLRLKLAQRESLPHNVGKALDKIFNRSFSNILNVMEKLLDSHMTGNRALGMKEDAIFEEATVLEDVQDLMHLVMYQQPTREEMAPLAMVQPPEEGWSGPAEGQLTMVAFSKGNLVKRSEYEQDNEGRNTQVETRCARDTTPTGKNSPTRGHRFNMQIPEEPNNLGQPMTIDTSVPDVPLKPNTERDSDLGISPTTSPPVGHKKDLHIDGEEQAPLTLWENAVVLIYKLMFYLTKMLVAILPIYVPPGFDCYGLPWNLVLITAFLGTVAFSMFLWRNILIVKERTYQVTLEQIADKVKTLKKENSELALKLLHL